MATAGSQMLPSGQGQETEEEDSTEEEGDASKTTSMREAAQKKKGSFNRPVGWMLAFGSVLAVCAGIVNVACMLHLKTVVSHMTGFATKIGLHLEGVRVSENIKYQNLLANSTLTTIDRWGHFDMFVEEVAIVLSFLFGAFLCGLVIPNNAVHFGGKSFYGVALIGNSALLVMAYLLALEEDDFVYAACCAACASGLQNAMCTMHLGAVVRTTHVTGTVTDIGSTGGRMAMIALRRLIRGTPFTYLERVELGVDFSKLQVLCMMFFAFSSGCYIGALLYSHLQLQTFLVPAVITGVSGIVYTFFREMMKQQFKKYEASQIRDEMEEVEDILQRTESMMKTHGRQRSSSEPDDVSELNDQVEHALERLHNLQGVLHEFYESDSESLSQEGDRVRSRSSRSHRSRREVE